MRDGEIGTRLRITLHPGIKLYGLKTKVSLKAKKLGFWKSTSTNRWHKDFDDFFKISGTQILV